MATLKVFAVDENNDIFIDDIGQLVIAEDEDAALIACQNAVKMQLGEAVLASLTGVPTLETVWSGSPDLLQFEYFVIQNIESVANVIRVSEINSSLSNGVVSYDATIETEFGEVFLSGGV